MPFNKIRFIRHLQIVAPVVLVSQDESLFHGRQNTLHISSLVVITEPKAGIVRLYQMNKPVQVVAVLTENRLNVHSLLGTDVAVVGENKDVEFRYTPGVGLAFMLHQMIQPAYAFNGFWCERVPGLQPTAGYPQDAKRFKAAIAKEQAELGIEDRALWRAK